MTVKLARNRRGASVAALSALALTLTACGESSGETTEGTGAADGAASGESEELSGNLPGAGASTQENAMQGWIAGFQDQHPDTTVAYDPVGSGAGREAFLNSAVLFAGSDAYMDPEEIEAASERCYGGEVLELPVYISPIAVAYNLPSVEAENINMTPEVIAGVFNGDVTSWDDPAIAEINPDIELPSTEIIPVNRSDDSGTTENFTEYLAEAAGDAWPHEASETWPISGTQSGSQTAGVVSTIESAEGTIGYIDASQVTDPMGTVAVGVGEEFVPFSPEAAAAVVDASPKTEDATDLRLTYDLARDTTESGVYPIVLISYDIACSTYDNEQDAANVAAFLTYVASEEGQQRAAQPDVAGSAPISDEMRQNIMNAIDQISAA